MSKHSKQHNSKHHAQLVCPHCHATQWEPKRAVSTYCRNCGQYFGIVDGQARSPKKPNGIVVPSQESRNPLPAADTKSPATPAVKGTWRSLIEKLPLSSPRTNGAHRKVVCPDCGFAQQVSASATSSICPSCSAYTSLEDVHIQHDSPNKIKTQGDVFIHKNAALQTGSITCRHLHAQGSVSGKIYCTGNATFSAHSKIAGAFTCQHLLIHRDAQVSFLQPVRAHSLEIIGDTSGDFYCDGAVKIGPKAAITGELLAKSLSIDPGGKLNGNFHICRDEIHAQEALREAEERTRVPNHFKSFDGEFFPKS
ncbi:MAG: polymer-forming cytoskeletal protein [Verrucomicrobiota bacterium]